MNSLKKRRELGLFQALIIGLGGAIGIEVFVLLNVAIRQAGYTIVSVLLVCGLVNLLTMLSFSELGAAVPEVGGEYSYAKAAFGGFLAFLTGWLRWISNVFGAALAAIGFSLHVLLLAQTSLSPLGQSLLVALLSVSVIAALAALSIRGTKQIGTTIVVAFIAVFLVFIAAGIWRGLEPRPFLPTDLKQSSGFITAITYSFLMFLGMRAIASGSATLKNPGKNIPRAIVLSAIMLIVLYSGIAYVTISTVSLEELANPDVLPLTLAAEKALGKVGGYVLTIAGVVAALSSLSTSMMVQSSIARGLSRDGYFPKFLLSTHKRFGTAHLAIIFGSVFYILFAATGVVEFIGSVAVFASLLGFALVNFSLLRLRMKKPYMQRPFRVPLYPYTPIAGIALSFILLLFIDPSAFSLGIAFIGLGVLAYYLRMVGHQRIRIAFGGMSLGIGFSIALLTYLIEIGFLLPLSIHQQFRIAVIYVLVVASTVSILAGALNIMSKI